LSRPIYNARTFEPRDCVGALVAMTRKAFLCAIDAELAPYDISAAQWIVIMQLYHNPLSTAGELARMLDYDPGAMTRLLDRLENKGMLTRAPSDSDRRSMALRLTPAARALRPKISAALAAANNHLLRGFSREEATLLENFLRRMLANA
jgi:DNA-binding MarR family transcriptional regulator